MRIQSFVTGSVLFLAAGLNMALAQHAGGHGGSAGHAYGSPGMSSSSFSNRSHSSSAGQLTLPPSIGLQKQYSGYTGINRGALANNNNRRRGYPGYNSYGVGYWPVYFSTYDDTPTPYVSPLQAQDPDTQDAEMAANDLGEQVAQLSAEVEALRNERGGSVYYGPPMAQGYMGQQQQPVPYAAPQAETQQEETAPVTPITLVLQGGKQVQLKNYAVMGNYVWDFSAQPAKRIALSTVDIGASRTATEAAGAEFPEIR